MATRPTHWSGWIQQAIMFTVYVIIMPAAFFILVGAPQPQPQPQPVHEPAGFDPGYEIREMEVTAYCPCSKCCGKWADGVTAAGFPAEGKLVAADWRILPLGTMVYVPGYSEDWVPVLDKGGAIKGDRLDVLFPTHQAALRWGRQHLTVAIMDGQVQ